MASSLESEWELELEEELEALGEGGHHELEDELEHHEHHEHHEFEDELESGEQFFGKVFRGIGRFVQRAAPMLKSIARVAAPIVGTAIGGPFGGMIGRFVSQALGEGESEEEFEVHEHHEFGHHEFEMELEDEFETHETHEHHEHHEQEVAHEIAHHETTEHEAIAEMLAEAAAHEQHEAQAEAMMGAAVVSTLTAADRRALRRVLPHLVRGVAILTRILRKRRATRPAVRAIPTIVRRTVNTLKKQAASGQPVTRKAAGRAAAVEIRRVLGSPSACTAAIRQNVKSTRNARPKAVAG